jgi:outer membrane protein assembly factor BamB|tara:strand:- start:698 stop:1819 length:1122 start_codon:yes stop_codon:yes gene_type:complete
MLIFFSACSSLSSLKFWGDDEADIDEPKALNKVSTSQNINIRWNESFEGENTLGNFLPSFSSQLVYFSDSNGNIKSLNSSNGKTNWEKNYGELSAGISAGFDILVVSDISGNVISLDQENGEELWKTNVKAQVLSSAAISPKFVVVKTDSGELIALDKNNGVISWSYRSKLPALTIRGSSSPVIDANQVYTTFDNGRMGVFDLDTGFPLWDGAISYVSGSSELENIIDSDSSPLIEGGYVYTTNYQGNLNIFDISQKRSVWQSQSSSFYSPLLIKGLIVLVESKSNFKTFFAKTLEESWISDSYLNRNLSNPISNSGFIIVGDFEGYIHIIDPVNGKTVGRKKISKKPIKALISRSKNFYAIDEAFNLYALNI